MRLPTPPTDPAALAQLPAAQQLCAELDNLGHRRWFCADSERLIQKYFREVGAAVWREAADYDAADSELREHFLSEARALENNTPEKPTPPCTTPKSPFAAHAEAQKIVDAFYNQVREQPHGAHCTCYPCVCAQLDVWKRRTPEIMQHKALYGAALTLVCELGYGDDFEHTPIELIRKNLEQLKAKRPPVEPAHERSYSDLDNPYAHLEPFLAARLREEETRLRQLGALGTNDSADPFYHETMKQAEFVRNYSGTAFNRQLEAAARKLEYFAASFTHTANLAATKRSLEQVTEQRDALASIIGGLMCPNFGPQVSFGGTPDPTLKVCGHCEVCVAKSQLAELKLTPAVKNSVDKPSA